MMGRENCLCLSELADDAYGPGGPMSGKEKPICPVHTTPPESVDALIKDMDHAMLCKAVEGIADDWMSSKDHHPGYVLIPEAKFSELRVAARIMKMRVSYEHAALSTTTPPEPEPVDELELVARTLAWTKYGIAWHHCEKVSQTELLGEARTILAALTAQRGLTLAKEGVGEEEHRKPTVVYDMKMPAYEYRNDSGKTEGGA